MTQASDRRNQLIDRLADHVLANGIAGSSLRPLAHAAGTSDRMLLYYFKDKDEIIAASVERLAARMTRLLEQATGTKLPVETLRSRILGVVMDDSLWPYMQLWLEIAALASRGDQLARRVGGQMARGFLAWGEAQLDSPAPDRHRADAALLLSMIEGMILLKSVGLDDVVGSITEARG